MGIFGGVISMLEIMRRWPKIKTWVNDGVVLMDIAEDHPAEIVWGTELMLNLVVLNKRKWKTGIVSWSAEVFTTVGTYKLDPLAIPNEYVVSRPGYLVGSETPETEWPVNDIRILTSHEFDHVAGWLRFAKSDMSAEVQKVEITAVTAIRGIRGKHRITWKPGDTHVNVWDTSDPKQSDVVAGFYGPKPSTNSSQEAQLNELDQ